jgi:hypothetical protein
LAELRDAIGRVPGLAIESVEPATEGYARLTATVPPGEDPRDAAAAALGGAVLRELRLELPSLEHFFQQVTEGHDHAAEVAP